MYLYIHTHNHTHTFTIAYLHTHTQSHIFSQLDALNHTSIRKHSQSDFNNQLNMYTHTLSISSSQSQKHTPIRSESYTLDYSSAFNTIVPATLAAKLQTLGLNRSLCSWFLDFLTGRSQVVRLGNNTSSPLILNTGASAGLRPQPTPVLPVHTRLYSHTQLQRHRQICWWRNGDRPDHRQRWDGLQRGGEYPDKMVSGEPPLTQHWQDQGAGGGFQETEQRTHTHHHRQDTC